MITLFCVKSFVITNVILEDFRLFHDDDESEINLVFITFDTCHLAHVAK